ncbi:uncharacterized protein LOC144562679 isoform X3 [Carex rostrata]
MEMDSHNNNNNRILQPLPDETIEARYQLFFINNIIKSPSFTTHPVIDKNGNPIKVAIYDTCTQSIISPDSILASAKVRLTVLDAKLWENKAKNWSRSDFDKSVLRARETAGPILRGRSLTIQLENGFGTFQNIYFNDNSSWRRSGFRLAVMLVGGGEDGYLNGERVLEVVSEPFRVLDRHVKAAQKPDQLKLTDNVQSIRKVGKGRASNLEENNIKTVDDFHWWYHNKQPELREILDIKSESDQSWRSMIEHTMTCPNEFHAKESMSNTDYVGRNMSLSTNGRPPIVGSGSSEPNPCENQIIEGNMPTICRPFTALCHFSSMIVLNRRISTASGEHIADTQHPLYPEANALGHPMGRNMSFCTYGGPPVVSSGPSQPIPGDMPIYVQFSAICEISSMYILNEHISTASGEHIAETQHPLFPETNALVHPMGRNMSLYTNDGPCVVGSGSSEPNPHENDIIEGLSQPEIPDMQSPTRSDSSVMSFVTSLFNNDDVGQQTLCKKRKMKALVRSVAFVTVVIKKRARIVPPANYRTTVPAI